MTTPRNNMIAALEGERPERIPFSVHPGLLFGDPALWAGLFRLGLCKVAYVNTVRERMPNVERIESRESHGVHEAKRVTLRTGAGSISELSVGHWIVEHFLKTPADYRVMEYIVRDTVLEAHYDAFDLAEKRIGDAGVTVAWVEPSPVQRILVQYTGVENLMYNFADEFRELPALIDAMMDLYVRSCEIVAAGPGRYVDMLENLTAETWGPARFAELHLPVYAKVLPILHRGGKKAYTHFDGKLACLADAVARTEIDGIESVTQAPEGDMTYAECRAAWPEKFLWGNINVSLYGLPPAEFKRAVRVMAMAGAVEGGLLAFGISEGLPENWSESIPVVLEALSELGW